MFLPFNIHKISQRPKVKTFANNKIKFSVNEKLTFCFMKARFNPLPDDKF